jgi:hypothetical protein
VYITLLLLCLFVRWTFLMSYWEKWGMLTDRWNVHLWKQVCSWRLKSFVDVIQCHWASISRCFRNVPSCPCICWFIVCGFSYTPFTAAR